MSKKNKRSKSKSPYCKSVDVLIKLKKEEIALQLTKLKRKCNQTDENRTVNPDRDTNISNIIKTNQVDSKKINDDSMNMKNKIVKIDTNNMTACQLKKRNERYKKEKLINVTLKDGVSTISPVPTESFPNISSPKNVQSKPSPSKPSPTKCSRQFKTSPSKGKDKFSDVRKKLLLDKRNSEKVINDLNDSNTNEESGGNKSPTSLEKEVSRRHARKLAYPLTNRDYRTNEMDAVHQNLIKMKKVAGQAMKVCINLLLFVEIYFHRIFYLLASSIRPASTHKTYPSSQLIHSTCSDFPEDNKSSKVEDQNSPYCHLCRGSSA